MTERRRGVSTAKVLGLAALAGTGAGVVLAQRRTAELDVVVELLEAPEVDLPTNAPDGRSSNSFIMPDEETLRGIPPYPGASPRKLLSRGVIESVPERVTWFQTTDSADAVLAFYEAAFTKAGRRPVARRVSPTMGYVAWLDEAQSPLEHDAKVRMVSAVGGGGATVVFLSAGQPQRLLDGTPRLPPDVELPPGATSVQVVSSVEVAGEARFVHAAAPELSDDEVLAFFRTSLARRGYAVTVEPDGAVYARRGDIAQTVRVTASAPTRFVVELGRVR